MIFYCLLDPLHWGIPFNGMVGGGVEKFRINLSQLSSKLELKMELSLAKYLFSEEISISIKNHLSKIAKSNYIYKG